jgi:D-3-phosphoglycerate dehydrogenase
MDQLSYPKNKIKILLLENIHDEAVEVFKAEDYNSLELVKGALFEDELIEKAKNVHLLGIRSGTQITKKVIDSCPKLLAIGCFCIGTNQVDLKAAMFKGIPVFNDPISNTRSVAELVVGLSIALMRDLFTKSAAAHAGQWKKVSHGAHEIRGKTLGIIGYGRIGMQVSVLAEAMGMKVFYYDVESKLPLGNAKPAPSLDELLKISDIVTLHVPESPLSNGLITKEKLALMKKTGYLINTSRGKVVDNHALAAALKNKTIKGAALDVFHTEPLNNALPFESPLQGLENVILTPHIGGATEEAQENIALAVSQKLIHFVDRGSTEGVANFPALSLQPNEGTHRILHIHNNVPGMLSQINALFAEKGINIIGQYLKTLPEIGYVVFDVNEQTTSRVLEDLKAIKGTIKTRILY